MDSLKPELEYCPIDCITMVVSNDEPCLGLYELDFQSPNSKGFHRYQIIQVMRNDKKSEAWFDLGLSKLFKHDPIRIPGGAQDDNGRFWIEHTVGELRDIADYIRDRPSFDKVELVCANSGAERIKT